MTRTLLLWLAGILTLGLSTVLYARLRPKPTPWRVEQRRKRRLSEELAEAGVG